MTDTIADVGPLVGRHFVSSGDNVCRFLRLGDGALQARWRKVASIADDRECLEWVEAILGAVAKVHQDPRTEAQALAEWQRSLRSGDDEDSDVRA